MVNFISIEREIALAYDAPGGVVLVALPLKIYSLPLFQEPVGKDERSDQFIFWGRRPLPGGFGKLLTSLVFRGLVPIAGKV